MILTFFFLFWPPFNVFLLELIIIKSWQFVGGGGVCFFFQLGPWQNTDFLKGVAVSSKNLGVIESKTEWWPLFIKWYRRVSWHFSPWSFLCIIPIVHFTVLYLGGWLICLARSSGAASSSRFSFISVTSSVKENLFYVLFPVRQTVLQIQMTLCFWSQGGPWESMVW